MDATFWAPFLRITSVILESSRRVPLPVRITSSASPEVQSFEGLESVIALVVKDETEFRFVSNFRLSAHQVETGVGRLLIFREVMDTLESPW